MIAGLYRSTALKLMILALVGAAIYSNTLNSPFYLDDYYLIKDNPIIKDLDYIVHPQRAMQLKEYGQHLRRYMGDVTFAINYRINGLNYPGYHIFNITLHIVNAILLYFFVSITLRTPLVRGTPLERGSGNVAFIVALVFVAHPVNTEAVTYIYQRVAALSFTFYVSSLSMYALARSGPFNRKRAAYYLLSVIFAIAAVKTKENSLTLPLALAAYEIVFFSASYRKRATLLAPFLLPILIYASALDHSGLSVKTVMLGQNRNVSNIVARSTYDTGYLDPSTRRLEYLLTESKVLATYLRLMVLPVDQNLLYDYPGAASPLEPLVILSIMLHLVLIALGAWLILLSRRRGKAALGVIGFGIWFFYIALIMESGIVPLPLFIAEYRLYLPSVGLLMAAVTALGIIYEKASYGRKETITLVAVTIVVISLCTATYMRNRVWSSEISLWSDVVSKAPRSSRGNYNLGTAYYDAGDYQNAVKYLERALQVKMKTAERTDRAYNNLSIAYIRLGMHDKAIGLLRDAISTTPGEVSLHYNLAGAYRNSGKWQEAVGAYGQALELDPQHYDSLIGLAEAYKVLRQPDRAIEEYEKALLARPGDFMASNNIASVLLREGRPEEALPYLNAALKASPGNQNTKMLFQSYEMMMKEKDRHTGTGN